MSVATLPLPTGAATSALQTALNAQIPSSLGAKTSANSLSVVLASDQATLPISGTVNQGTGGVSAWKVDGSAVTQPVSAAALPLPTGAATAAKQPALGVAGTPSADVLTVQGAASMTALKVDGSAVTQPISASALPLPAGAATSALQTAISGQLPATLGQKTSAASLAVVLASDQSSVPTKLAGKASINHVRNDYTSTSVTTGAYVQLIASTAAAISEIFIFDSSGQTLVLATGGSGSEVDQIYIVPGGNGEVPLAIAASTRVSIKAVSATANVGEIDINLFG